MPECICYFFLHAGFLLNIGEVQHRWRLYQKAGQHKINKCHLLNVCWLVERDPNFAAIVSQLSRDCLRKHASICKLLLKCSGNLNTESVYCNCTFAPEAGAHLPTHVVKLILNDVGSHTAFLQCEFGTQIFPEPQSPSMLQFPAQHSSQIQVKLSVYNTTAYKSGWKTH